MMTRDEQAKSLTFAKALAGAAAKLELANIENAGFDARLLMQAATGLSFADLVSKSRDLVPLTALSKLDDLLDQRLDGKPVNRILGFAEFYSRPFQLSADTLEPRADTEVLVDVCLELMADYQAPRFADIGTGSGAIAITLALECDQAYGVATDLSRGALEMAQSNAKTLGAHALSFSAGSYLEPLQSEDAFDLIVSNPPYIASEVMESLSPEVRQHDPVLALDGGMDGLDAYRNLIADAPAHLSATGHLVLEIGYDQKEPLFDLVDKQKGLDHAICHQDLAGNDRVIVAQKQA